MAPPFRLRRVGVVLVNNQIDPDTLRIPARYHAQMHCRGLSARLLLDAYFEFFVVVLALIRAIPEKSEPVSM